VKTKTLVAIVLSLCVAAGASAQVKWVKTYEAAVKQAKAQKRLIFVDFYADW
jgi:thiol:disulfide interchange protein